MTNLASSSDNSLERYIKRVLEIQEQHKHRVVTEVELKQIALDLNMSEKDLEKIDEEFQGHFDRGIGFMKFKNWQSAREELEQALDLKPYHDNTMLMLSATFQQMFYKSGQVELKNNALALSRRCIQQNAKNLDAYKIITELEGDKIAVSKPKKDNELIASITRMLPTSQGKRNLVVAAGMLGLMTLVGGFGAAIFTVVSAFIILGLVLLVVA